MRIPISLRGSIGNGHRVSPCLVHDMSHSGLLIVCAEPFDEGQVLELTCSKPQGKSLSCKVQVRHRDEDVMGVAILEIHAQSEHGYRLYTQAEDPAASCVA